jgi:hypothetical protein
MAKVFKSVLGGIFGGAPKPKPLPPVPEPTPTPTIDEAKTQQQASDEIERRKGRAATMFTSAQGDTSKPKLGAAQVLGY